MNVLEVKGLCKTYPGFQLRDVSFSLPEGQITGFIGRNGAGKTTALKSLFRFVHPDSGEIRFFGEAFQENELSIKQRIGFISGGADYYPKKKLRTITAVTKSFYRGWNEEDYRRYLGLFHLDESKTPSQLSAGMKVKYALALALSHNAKLLILDEPTSGLDPVSRDELMDIFMELCREGVTILFSTHITSDLEKCADRIIYIHNGRILAESELQTFVSSYQVLTLSAEQLTDALSPLLLGLKPAKYGYSALIRTKDAVKAGLSGTAADLESIMIHIEKEESVNKLLKKELLLSMHPTALLFLALSAMLLIPNYPYYFVFFYTALAVFFTCLNGRENHDVFYTLTLPVAKRDIVRARMNFVMLLETAQCVLAVPFAAIRQMMPIPGNQVGMDANIALFGVALVLLGVFNLVFFTAYYRDVTKVGTAFLRGTVVMVFLILLAEASVHIVPFIRERLDTPEPYFLTEKFILLTAGVLLYLLLNFIACRTAIKFFEKQDL